MKTIDVVALGELLIDLTNCGVSGQGHPLFEANPGGAPANVLAMLCQLGRSAAFIGKVGEDDFGRQLRKTLRALGIDDRGLCTDTQAPTTLAVVHNDADGERRFSFYRHPGADCMLTQDEVPGDLIAAAKIFHFGSLSMTGEPVRAATKWALQRAKEAGCLISFDPNLRPPLWDSLQTAKQQILYGLSVCDILKISDDELLWLTDTADIPHGVAALRRRCAPALIFVTAGAGGSYAYYKDVEAFAPAVLQKGTVDCTGAGDTFMGCALHGVLTRGLDALTASDLQELLRFANAAASIVTTRRGALRCMPAPEEIRALLQKG